MNEVAGSSQHKPRALITGINGFTGPYAAKELEQAGYQIFGICNVGSSGNEAIYKVDLCDSESVLNAIELINPDVVVHLAAISFVPHGNVEDIYKINIVATNNLLAALDKSSHAPRAILLASSSQVYGKSAVGLVDESFDPLPENDYAVSKLAMEHMARLWLDRLPIFFVRPFNYTGVGQAPHFVIPKIVSHYGSNEVKIELGNINIIRDFSDVRMVASVYRKLLDVAPIGEAINICSGGGCSIKKVLTELSDIAGYQIQVSVNPDFVRADEVKAVVGCNDKLHSIVGDFDIIPIRETLEWMYDDFKNSNQQ
ncbi:MAG: GDP-mannose 4,6-dehydratase [bacterium]